jgi:formate dehydrogenase iron-sulfur subunit
MALPLLARAADDDGTFVVVSDTAASAPAGVAPRQAVCGIGASGLVPDRQPSAGEQYRFHIDMGACIGCKCCVVACNEQNGNPADINWRRVAEVEGGRYPLARRAYMSMGCNHCADPTCLAGCPVDAYSKDAATGIVHHSADTCIGCQYCTWTCSYGVPQFNAERGVVGKCDMCHGRLALGQAPACVNACPEGAIGIEIVNVAEWRRRTGPHDSRPNGDGSLSTTSVTLPARLPAGMRPVDAAFVKPADPHWPLVVMTVLTQLAAGAFAAIWLSLVLAGASATLPLASAVAFGILGFSLVASTLHLGRPIHAYRAMKMWRRSWLSREVVLFGAFAKAAAAFTAVVWLGWPGATAIGAAAAVLGVAGVIASGFIYQVPSRPLWQSPRTFVQFFMTMFLLGCLFAASAGLPGAGVWRALVIAASVVKLGFILDTLRVLGASSSPELRGARRLLLGDLVAPVGVRDALLIVGGLLLPVMAGGTAAAGASLILVAASEIAGRYLFFAAAVPRHMTAPYLAAPEEEAA